MVGERLNVNSHKTFLSLALPTDLTILSAPEKAVDAGDRQWYRNMKLQIGQAL